LAQPYCSISAAVTARGGPGTVILIEPGIYREQVAIEVSGTVAAPLELRADGPGVVIDGADDFSSQALWTPYAGDVWLAQSVTWSPRQVFTDGTRLAVSSAAPDSLPARSFCWVPQAGLFVNAGGGSPADHQAKVGHRAGGFIASGRAGLVIDGFTVTRADDRGICLLGGCENVTITDNVVTFAGRAGIHAAGGFGLRLGSNVVSDNGDHGITLTGGVSGAVVEDNDCFRNANPTQGDADGIHIAGGRGITIRRNRLHGNQDSGLDLQSGSSNCMSLQNLSWNNGGHGFDHVGAGGTTHVCDVAFGNLGNGFSIQGRSTGTRIFDSISSENGFASGGFDLWIDAGSGIDLVSNYNVFWNSNGRPTVRSMTPPGSSLIAYATASGQDLQTLEADPLFVDPAGGDFHLRAGSPAIDAASSAVPGWSATDAEGGPRRDDWASANTGAGPVPYGDRGAFEYVPADRAPLVIAPAAIAVAEGSPLSITVHAADPDGQAIAALTADLSGLPPGANASFVAGPGDTTGTLTWNPTYADSGTYHVTFTAANTLSGSDTTSITVTDVYHPYAAGTYYVDISNPACSSHGPGTAAQPYCEIDEALDDHAGPGVAIVVKPGVYHERVSISASGAAGSPLILHADGNVVVEGADDFSDPAQWQPFSGNVWLASSVNWAPLQVFADGGRLAASGATPSSLPARSFRCTTAGLYVNAGGGNPASHQVQVGHRKYGFIAYSEQWLTIEGFTVLHTEDRGIFMAEACENVNVLHNTVRFANKYGIQASGGDAFVIGSNIVSDSNDHGISITTGVTGSIVEDNESYRNARPSERAANGIYVHDSPGNLFRRNRLHDNQDTGLHFQAGANNNICYLNRSWNNGDHGYDHLGASGTLHVCDVAYGNYKDGFSIEGTSPGTQIYNSIAVNNGLTTNEFDLWVEDSSIQGFVSNHNLFWNSTSQAPVKYVTTLYSSVAAYGALSGQDTQSLQADPRFTNPAAGDFHLNAGSPAIDAGDSGVPNWPALDAEGRARVDDPMHPNGVGPVPYSDLGALEYRPAILALAPTGGTAPLMVTADASGSLGPDGTAVSYRFDFGDGVVVGPQAGPSASHSYGAGNWTATVTVAGQNGGTSAAAATLTVNAPPHAALAAEPATGGAPLSVTLNASASSDPDGKVVSYRFDFGDGTVLGPQADPTASHVYAAGTWTPRVTVTDDAGGSAAASVTVVSLSAGGDAPVVKTDSTVTVAEATPLTITVHAADPDGDVIESLSARLTGLPAGNNAVFTPGPGDTTGTLTWTPTYADSGSYAVTFVASNDLEGLATTVITVSNVDRAPAVTAPATAPAAGAVTLAIAVSAHDADGDSIATLSADLSHLPPGNDAVFVAGPGDTTGTLHWTPTAADTGTYDVTFTAANALAGSAVTTISVRAFDQPPGAVLVAAPTTGNAPLNVFADASGSTETDGTIVSYRFDFGDGTVSGPQAAATASHVYAAGSFTLSVTVTDDVGGQSTASVPIIAAATGGGTNLVMNPSFEGNTSGWSGYDGATLQRVPGGFDGASSLQVTGADSVASFGATDSPNWVGATPAAGTRYRIAAWVRADSADGEARLRIREYLGGVRIGAAAYLSNTVELSPTWQLLEFDFVCQSAGSTLDLQIEDVPLAPREKFQADNVSIRVVTGAAPARAGDPRGAGCSASAEESVLDLNAGQAAWKVRFAPSRDADGKPDRYSRLALQYREGEAATGLVAASGDGGWGPLEVWFNRTDLRKLFAGLAPGRKTVTATMIAERSDGTTQSVPLTFDVVGAPAPLQPIVTPNPMRASGVIGFATSSRGLLQADIFDATGRRVRRLAGRAESAAGWHDLTLDGRDDTGARLAAGIYFYRIVSVDGVANGRLVLLR
jgi:hypothetical protein